MTFKGILLMITSFFPIKSKKVNRTRIGDFLWFVS